MVENTPKNQISQAMNLHGWEFHELDVSMRGKNHAELLTLYQQKHEQYVNKCVEFVDASKDIDSDTRHDIERECEFLDKCRAKIALRIADQLIGN